jgi:hypothetical protein
MRQSMEVLHFVPVRLCNVEFILSIIARKAKFNISLKNFTPFYKSDDFYQLLNFNGHIDLSERK